MASAAEVKPKAGFGFRVSAAWPSSASISKSLRVPIRVCRPLLTGEALRRSPLTEAGGAYPASVEGVPLIAATTRPAVILAGRPAAERAPNARTGRVEAFLLFGLAINNNRGVIREGVHDRLLSPFGSTCVAENPVTSAEEVSSIQSDSLSSPDRESLSFSRFHEYLSPQQEFYLVFRSSAHPSLRSSAETRDRIRPWTYLYSPGIHRSAGLHPSRPSSRSEGGHCLIHRRPTDPFPRRQSGITNRAEAPPPEAKIQLKENNASYCQLLWRVVQLIGRLSHCLRQLSEASRPNTAMLNREPS